MPDTNRPRKGSLGFSPRKRAVSETPRFNSWPDDDGQPGLQGFAGYKAGMTHVVLINDEPDSPREGMEETVPVTVIETPPMRAVALRAYEDTPYGLRPLTDVWTDERAQYLSPDMATSAFDRLGLPTPPAIVKEQPAAHTDIARYTEAEEFPSSAWRDGRAAGVLIRDKTGTRAQAWRPRVTEAESAHDAQSAESLTEQYATEARLAAVVDRLQNAGEAPSVETVRDRVVADIAREHYPVLYHDGAPVVSMRAFESAVAETVHRYLASES